MRIALAALIYVAFCGWTLAAQEQPEPQRTAPPLRTPSGARPAGAMPAPGLAPRPLPTKPGKMVAFELIIVDLNEPLDAPSALSILERQKAGNYNYIARFELASLEDQPAWVQFGEMTPRISGQTRTASQTVPIYNDINVGTMVQITAHVEEDGSVVAQVNVERSALSGGSERPTDPNVPFQPKTIERLVANMTVRLTPGEPQIVGGRKVSEGRDANKTWIVMTAKLGVLKIEQK